MANVKISALPAAITPLTGTEVLPIVQSGVTAKVSVADLTSGRAITASSVTDSALTSGRVIYAGTAGVLQDSSALTFDGAILSTNTLNLSTALGIAYGGTGQITANAAINALLPSQTGNAGKFYTTDGTNTSWSTNPLGTVTSVSGTAPVSVATGTTTPVISMAAATGSVNGYLSSTDWTTFNNKGSGTVTSVSGTTGRITSTGGTTPVIDLASGVATAGTTGSSTLIPVVTIDTYGRVTSITTASNPQGTVTSVTGTAPVVSSGGATPAISMPVATTSVSGYLSSTDWTTFNNKGSVSSVAMTVPTFLSVSGSPVTTSGTLAVTLSGTALPIANGGTGATTLAGANIALINTAQTFSATQTLNGTSATTAAKVSNITELASVTGTAPTATTNFYINTGAVQYITANNANNWTLNFAFSSGTTLNTAMATNDSISCTLIVTNTTTAYYASAFTIDGTSVTPKWQNGAAPTSGNTSALDIYTFVIIKTAASTYTVLASQTKFA